MPPQTIAVRGLRPFLAACRRAEAGTIEKVKAALGSTGEAVLEEWQHSLRPVHERSAAGLRIAVDSRGVAVRQSIRKSSSRQRRRPNFGGIQQRMGDTALENHAHQLERDVEDALDRVVRSFDR